MIAEASSEFDYLRDKQRQLREQNPPELNLRTHRSISWIVRAAALIDEDPDAAFIFCWIAFNAAYAKDVDDEPGSFARVDCQKFFDALVRCDPKGRIGHEIWHHFEGVVAELLDNKYIFSPFWKFHNGDLEYAGVPPLKWSTNWDSIVPFQEDQKWQESETNPKTWC